jgi:hypothetical protein
MNGIASPYGFPNLIDPLVSIINLILFFGLIIGIVFFITLLIAYWKQKPLVKKVLLFSVIIAAISLISALIIVDLYSFLSATPDESSYERVVIRNNQGVNFTIFYSSLLLMSIIFSILINKKFNKEASSLTIIIIILLSSFLAIIPSIPTRNMIFDPYPTTINLIR